MNPLLAVSHSLLMTFGIMHTHDATSYFQERTVPSADKFNTRPVAVYFIDVLFWKNIALFTSNKKNDRLCTYNFFFLNTNTVKGVSSA